MEHSDIKVRERNLSSTEKCHNDECVPDCIPLPPPPPSEHTKLEDWTRGYASWNCLGVHSFSALSLGLSFFCVLCVNGVCSLLSLNSLLSVLSANSCLSILSSNSVLAIGCNNRNMAICF